MKNLALGLALLSVTAVACFKPLEVSTADIPKLQSLAEVMRGLETENGPSWKFIGSDTLEDPQWTALGEHAKRSQALAERAANFSRGAAFDGYQKALLGQAGTLDAAVQAKDAKAASDALEKMKATCKACHAETR